MENHYRNLQMHKKKWTVRHVDLEAIDMLLEVQETSGERLGDLVSEAISYWYDFACVEEDEDSKRDKA